MRILNIIGERKITVEFSEEELKFITHLLGNTSYNQRMNTFKTMGVKINLSDDQQQELYSKLADLFE